MQWMLSAPAKRAAVSMPQSSAARSQFVTAGDHVIVIGLVEHADTHSFEPLHNRQRSLGTVTHTRT